MIEIVLYLSELQSAILWRSNWKIPKNETLYRKYFSTILIINLQAIFWIGCRGEGEGVKREKFSCD